MAVPSVVGAGAVGVTPNSATASMTATGMTLPAGVQAGDLLLMFAAFDTGTTTTGQAINAPAGWTTLSMFAGTFGATGGGLGISVFYKIAVGGDATPSPTFVGATTGTSGGTGLCAVVAFRDVDTSAMTGSALAGSVGGNTNTGVQNVGQLTGFTPTADDTIIVIYGAKKDDWTSIATPTPTDGLTWTNNVAAASTNAGDAGFVVATASQGTAGAISNKSFTVTGGATATIVGRMFALKGTPVVSGNALEQAVDDTLDVADDIATAPSKTIADTATVADALGKDIQLSLADSIAFADGVALQPNLGVADAIGVADNVTPQSGIAYFVTPTDAIALTDSVRFNVSAAIADTAALADAIAKQLNTQIADALAITEQRVLAFSKAQVDTISLADAIASQTGKTVAEVIALADGLASQSGKSLADNVSIADDLASQATWARTFNDNLNLSDEISSQVTRSDADNIAMNDQVSFQTGKWQAIADSLVMSDSVLLTIFLALADGVAFADAIAKTISRSNADTLAVADQIAKSFNIPLASVLVLSDAVSFNQLGTALELLINDAVSFADHVDLSYMKAVVDQIVLADAHRADVEALREDVIAINDTVTLSADRDQLVADILDLSDQIAIGTGLELEDTVELLDDVNLQLTINEIITQLKVILSALIETARIEAVTDAVKSAIVQDRADISAVSTSVRVEAR